MAAVTSFACAKLATDLPDYRWSREYKSSNFASVSSIPRPDQPPHTLRKTYDEDQWSLKWPQILSILPPRPIWLRNSPEKNSDSRDFSIKTYYNIAPSEYKFLITATLITPENSGNSMLISYAVPHFDQDFKTLLIEYLWKVFLTYLSLRRENVGVFLMKWS